MALHHSSIKDTRIAASISFVSYISSLPTLHLVKQANSTTLHFLLHLCMVLSCILLSLMLSQPGHVLPLAAGSNHPALPQEGLPRHQPQPVHPEGRKLPHLLVRLYTDRLSFPRQHGNRLARQETLSQTLAQLSLASCRNLKAMCLLLLMGRQQPVVLIAKLTPKTEWTAQIKRDLVHSALTVAKC